MSTLDTRTIKITGFVRDRVDLPLDKFDVLKDYFTQNAVRFGISIHDKDIGKDGLPEPVHFHFCADMKSSKRLITFIREISDKLQVPALAVSIEKYVTFEGAFQYLCHLTDLDKYQYGRDAIVHNLSKDDFEIVMSWTSTSMNYDAIYKAVISSNSLSEVIGRLGLSSYTKFRWAILDCWKEFHNTGLLYDSKMHCLKEIPQ